MLVSLLFSGTLARRCRCVLDGGILLRNLMREMHRFRCDTCDAYISSPVDPRSPYRLRRSQPHLERWVTQAVPGQQCRLYTVDTLRCGHHHNPVKTVS